MASRRANPGRGSRMSKRGRNSPFFSVVKDIGIQPSTSQLQSKSKMGGDFAEREEELSVSDDFGLLREAYKDQVVVEDECDQNEDEDESESFSSEEQQFEERSNFESQVSESYEPLSRDWKNGIPAHWEAIFPVLVATGTGRMSQEHYKILQSTLRWKCKIHLPSISTLKRTIRPMLCSSAFVPSFPAQFPVDSRKSGARGGVGLHCSATHAPVNVVLPSSWARRDLSTHVMQRIIMGLDNGGGESSSILFSSIENTPIVQYREEVLSPFKLRDSESNLRPLTPGCQLVLSISTNVHTIRLLKERTAFTNGPEGEVLVLGEIQKVTTVGPRSQGQSGVKGVVGDVIVDFKPKGGSQTSLCMIYRIRLDPTVSDDRRLSLCFHESGRTELIVPIQHAVLYKESSKKRTKAAPSEGRLLNGERYFVYRMFLYADGFTPLVGKKGSMGGCYMLPLGITPRLRTVAGSIRKLSLTPAGISTNHILSHIINDIVKGTTEGFKDLDSEGNCVTIFLDVVGYIADYPALSEAIDVLGHTSNVPCHLCFFQKYDQSGARGADYGYATDIVSSNLIFCRYRDRTLALREAGLSDNEFRQLGLHDTKTFESKLNPLEELSTRMEEARPLVPKTQHGVPVVPAIFDVYRSCIIAPDHLFLGLAKDAINFVLSSCTPAERKLSQSLALNYLRENSLGMQTRLFNIEKHEVLSMSISSMFDLLLVAPYSFRQACYLRGTSTIGRDQAVSLLEHLSTLLSSTHYVPDELIDGKRNINFYEKDNGELRLRCLLRRAEEYIQRVSKLCEHSASAKKYLDKPNLHRMLEFYNYTLPSFGNVAHIQELIFEKAHQELKKGVSKSNHKNPQLQAMEHALGNDWAVRLCMEVERHFDEGWSDSVVKSIRRLLGDEDWKREVTERNRRQVRDAFPPPVMVALRTTRDKSCTPLANHKLWMAGQKRSGMAISNNPDSESPLLERAAVLVSQYIEGDLQVCSGSETHANLEAFSLSSIRWVGRKGKHQQSNTTLSELFVGSVIQKVSTFSIDSCREGDLILLKDRDKGDRGYWMIVASFVIEGAGAFYNNSVRGNCFTVAKPCLLTDGSIITVYPGDVHCVFRLSSDVRAALIIHNCMSPDSNCVLNDGGTVSHEPLLSHGGSYKVYGRSEGFPPRHG